jgi:hypothetical protein
VAGSREGASLTVEGELAACEMTPTLTGTAADDVISGLGGSDGSPIVP